MQPIRFIILFLFFLFWVWTKESQKTLKIAKDEEMFNKILFIIIYFNITIPVIFIFMEDLRFWIFFYPHPQPHKNTRERKSPYHCYHLTSCLPFASVLSLKTLILKVHPCGRYRHNTVVFILAKEYNLKNLRTIHRLDRLTSGLLLFGRSPKKARQMEHQIRNRQVQKQYICRVEGEFPE